MATYSAVILLVAVLINLATSFSQYTHSLTLPSMQTGLDLSYTQIGILITGGWAVRNISSFSAGTLAPRYGSRMIIGVSTLLAGGSMIMLGASDNFWMALAAMALTGIGSGAALTPMMGLLSPWFDSKSRGLAAGLASVGGSAAFVASGVLVPWLVTRSPEHGWQHTWYIFGFLVLGVGVVSLFFIRDNPPESAESSGGSGSSGGSPDAAREGREDRRTRRRNPWPVAAYKNRFVWLVTFMVFLSGWSQGVFHTFFAVYITQENGVALSTAGALLVTMGVLGAGSGVMSGRISDRIGRPKGFFITFMFQAVGYGLFWIVPNIGVFIICTVLIGLTLRSSYVICAASAGDYLPGNAATAAFGLMSVGAGLGTAISPTLAGAIADATGTLRWSFSLATGASIVAMGASLLLHRMTTRQSSAVPDTLTG
ncbi:MAG: MFS transporter [Chloroflexi bacterium]|nr:MFS transporter [Chloroflexota bacterium]